MYGKQQSCLGLLLWACLVPAAADEVAGAGLPALAPSAEAESWELLRQEGARLLQPSALLEFLDQVDASGTEGATQALGAEAYELLQALLATGLHTLENGADEPGLKSLDLSFNPATYDAEQALTADLLLSLYGHGRSTLFSQGGVQVQDGQSAFNVGLGYRWALAEQWLLGGNVFYDHLSDTGTDRYSLGLEVKGLWLDLYGNIYRGLNGGGSAEARADGWDVELAGRVPQLPWIEVLGRYYFWEDIHGNRNGLTGLEYGLRLQASSFAGLELRYDTPESGLAEFGLEANLQYYFGVPLATQLKFQEDTGAASLVRRFEKVRRQAQLSTGARTGDTFSGMVYVGAGMTRGQPLGRVVVRPAAGAPQLVTVKLRGLLAQSGTADDVRLQLSGSARSEMDYVPVAPADVSGIAFSGGRATAALAPEQFVLLRFHVLPGNGDGGRRQLRLQLDDRVPLLLFEIHPSAGRQGALPQQSP